MFQKRRVTVEVGDIFIETLSGKQKIFRSLGIADQAPKGTFQSFWEVTELCNFNGLPHGRLTNRETGQVRTIAMDALERQEIYTKQTRS